MVLSAMYHILMLAGPLTSAEHIFSSWVGW